jgi:hypothetical protein
VKPGLGDIAMQEIDDILASDLSDLEKLAKVFRWITDFYIRNAEMEIELQKALGDQDALVKEQIKQSVFQHAQSIFQQSHLLVTKRKAWDD